MNGLSAPGVAAAVAVEADQALHASLQPLTVVTGQPIEAPTLLPPQSTAPAIPVESMMEAASVAPVAVEPAPQPPPPPIYIVHTVQDGDTVNGLAAGYGISPSSILWSNLDLESADSLTPGQYLRIPMRDGIIYDVRPGDTLSDIAGRFGVDVQAIVDFSGNNLRSADSIAENQTIFIPGGTMPVAPATSTPTPPPEPPPTPPPEPPTATPLPAPPVSSPSGVGTQAVELARSRIGAPYVAGAAGPNAFDCSGLVYWVYSQLGLDVPRTSWEQFAWASPVGASQLQPGDLVFFSAYSGGSVNHVGIYVGGGMVVMAVDDGDFVREVALSESYWSDHFAGAGRPP